ncbi:MAG: alpha-2-macroglobulin family protein [Rhodobacteraceae bacterium]|jgi:uncharacterized protein YfaS (alpha-2-macroglobulin family)|nr:alpha-2-macroglobulin family protein [Paracoccaceae bacterium]
MSARPSPAFRILLAAAVALGLAPAPALAQQSPVPERRAALTSDIDFYGSDLRSIFDTTLEACQRACLSDAACKAFTFNTRSRACFPKSAADDPRAFAGAVSARVYDTDPAVLARVAARQSELGFLSSYDFGRARTQAEGLAALHVSDEWTAEDFRSAEARARASGDLRAAAHFIGSRINLTDSPADWIAYAETLAAIEERNFNARDQLRARALQAATNAYLRAAAAGRRAAALKAMARPLEELGRGRDALRAVRLAQEVAPDAATAELLAQLEERHGFRIVEHLVESDLARPRLCAVFSEPLADSGVDYLPFVRAEAPGLAVEAEFRQLCVSGLEHGRSYTVTFRAGLPSGEGERLGRSATIEAYVRDRTPAVRIAGRAYILPRGGAVAIPVETVNTARLDLRLMRVDDRNLVRSVLDRYFGRPLQDYEDEEFVAGIAEEVWSGTAEVAMEVNRDMTTRLPLDEVLGGLPAGVYVLRAAVPDTESWEHPAAHQWFVVSDLGMTTLAGADGLHVIVRSLGSAGAREGVRLTLLARSNRVLGEAVTDAQGYARFAPGLARGTGAAAPALVLAEDGDDLAFLPLTDPEFDLSDRGVSGRPAAPAVDVFATTDRGAYRAGEVVNVTALARDPEGRGIAGLPLTIRTLRPDGVEYSRALSREAGAGGHVFAVPIAGTAPRGRWRYEVIADPSAPALAAGGFLVEDFLPERIDFELALPEAPIRPGDSPTLDMAARYLFGAPAAGLAIEGEVVLRAAAEVEGFPGFRFGRHDERFSPVMEPLPLGSRTDADGRARLSVVLPEVRDPARPLEMILAVRVAEGSGRPVERRATRLLAPAMPVLGLKPAFDEVVGEGEDARFAMVAVAPPGEASPVPVRWTVSRIETRYQWYQLYGSWNYEPVTTRSRVAEGTATLAPGRAVEIAAPVGWGRHEIRVERSDGAPGAASMEFYAGWYAPAETATTPDALEVALDRDAYRPGDTARVRVEARAAGVALVTVLSNRLIDLKAVELPEGESVIELPVTDDWGAGAYVTVSLLRPMDVPAGRNPARALGLAHAAVDPGARRLSARFEGAAEVDPRRPMDIALKVEGLAPGAVAHATVAAIDVGILNLTSFVPPDPSGHYFGQRRLGVGIRDLYGRLIDGMSGSLGSVRSGGDGGMATRFDAPPPTEELVAYFSGPLEVGPDGYARTSFNLPAFNGTVRLMAVVWSGAAVGEATADVLVRDPVVVTASLPRFLAPGDESRLLLELTHATGPAGVMGLEYDALGLTLEGAPASVTLASGGSTRLSVPLTVSDPGLARLTVTLVTPDGRRLAKSLALPVEANDPEIVRRSRFGLAQGQTFTFDAAAFAGLRRGTGRATLAIGPVARFDTPGLLRTLDSYPYGCSEQLVSAAMPLLYLSGTAEAMGLGNALTLRLRVAQTVGRVLLNQSSEGGFGLWGPGGGGDLWLDAYVADFLSRARAEGVTVPEVAFRMALTNLRNQLSYAGDFDEGGARYAYALMVLAREGAAAIGDLRYYADIKAAAFDTPLAAAMLGAALATYGDQPRADRMFAQAVALMEGDADDPSLWREDYGTARRDAAAVLTLASWSGSQVVNTNAIAARIEVPEGSVRLSTQEAMWTLLAAHALVDRPGGQGFTIDGAPVEGPLVRLFEDALGAPVAVTNGSGRDEVLTLTTFGVPEVAEPAGGNGYAIRRGYYTLEGELASPAEVAAGTRLVAVLEVEPFAPVEARLIVDDPLPAGFEIDNPSLLGSGQINALDWLETTSDVATTEFRQDRFLAAIDWRSDTRFRLAYIVRATSPGSFHHPPALVEDMYRREFRAWTDAGRVTVIP